MAEWPTNEHDARNWIRAYRRALELDPTSVRLWQKLNALEERFAKQNEQAALDDTRKWELPDPKEYSAKK